MSPAGLLPTIATFTARRSPAIAGQRSEGVKAATPAGFRRLPRVTLAGGIEPCVGGVEIQERRGVPAERESHDLPEDKDVVVHAGRRDTMRHSSVARAPSSRATPVFPR